MCPAGTGGQEVCLAGGSGQEVCLAEGYGKDPVLRPGPFPITHDHGFSVSSVFYSVPPDRFSPQGVFFCFPGFI